MKKLIVFAIALAGLQSHARTVNYVELNWCNVEEGESLKIPLSPGQKITGQIKTRPELVYQVEFRPFVVENVKRQYLMVVFENTLTKEKEFLKIAAPESPEKPGQGIMVSDDITCHKKALGRPKDATTLNIQAVINLVAP